jgi:hypothetical protein
MFPLKNGIDAAAARINRLPHTRSATEAVPNRRTGRQRFDESIPVNENTKSPSDTSGPVAQLGARFHGMEEVTGSIPVRSTNYTFQIILCSPKTSVNAGFFVV